MGKLVWLASYPKSGNTWARIFLHNYITQPEQPHSVNRLTDFSVSECHGMFYKKYDPRRPDFLSTKEVQALRPQVQRDLMGLHDDLIFVKTHNAALEIHGVKLCAPEVTAGSIVLVRDPRDVAISYSKFLGLSLDETIVFMGNEGAANRGTADRVFEFIGSWSMNVASWLESAGRLVLRYEDMLAAPEITFAKIIRFLGEDPPPERLSRAIAFSAFPVLATQEREQGYQAKGEIAAPFFREGRAGQWKDILSPAQISKIETDHGPIMRRMGYLK